MGRAAVAAFLTCLSAGACARLPMPPAPTVEEHMERGARFQALGLRTSSLREYQSARRRDPGFVPAYLALAHMAFEGGELVEAESYYRQALRLAPESAEAANGLASVHLARGRKLDEAEALARRAASVDGPQRPYALDIMARVHIRRGRYALAAAALEEARKLAPHDPRLQERLARSRAELDNAARAAEARRTGSGALARPAREGER